MIGDRQLRILAHPGQWARCSHRGTSLLPDGGVELTWSDPPTAAGTLASCQPVVPAGLVFDRWCRGHATGARTGAAVDGRQRLYVADTCDRSIRVSDLWAARPLRRIPVEGAGHRDRRPVDVAADGQRVVVLVDRPPGLLLLDGRRDPRRGPALTQPCHPPTLRPARLAIRGDLVLVLWSDSAGSGDAVVRRPDGSLELRVPGATDLDLAPDGTLVVARGPGQSFRRWEARDERWIELTPLRADGYDGGAVTVAPNGRVAFTTRDGWAWTSGSAATYVASGEVRSYRLDSGAYRTRWGRVFLEGCIPPGTSVTLRFVTTDEDEVRDPLSRQQPDRGTLVGTEVDGPPLPSQTLLDALSEPCRLAERSEPPWPGEPTAQVFETPVRAPAGRYLWMVAELVGTAHASPRITAISVEAPGHRLDRALPRTWTAAEGDAAYLQRFLAPAEGILHDLDSKAALRAVLLDPTATPTEALAWLGSFLGLVLDERWPEDARRELVASAFDLFRVRGTQGCLERLLRLYLNVPVAVVENWRLRGLGGGVLSAPPTGPRAPGVGAGTPLAGQLGRFVVGGVRPEEDGYTATAHRFTVLVGADLSPAQLDVVQHIVETHKPAHTLGEICQFGSGMRLGSSTRVGLSSFVGPGAAWGPAVVGQVSVGGDGVVGSPSAASRVAETSYVGEVRVG